MDAVVIFCTVPNKDEAKKISEALLKEKLAACVSTVDKVSSMFLWNEELCKENELLLIIKTKRELFATNRSVTAPCESVLSGVMVVRSVVLYKTPDVK